MVMKIPIYTFLIDRKDNAPKDITPGKIASFFGWFIKKIKISNNRDVVFDLLNSNNDFFETNNFTK
jgi:hypothetical protein